ncbi:4-hydroxythreonine-4-phosphate dehydrogenase PdxA [Mariniblastus sp.]|nr:4-hydroxythreonine-4-phosphate dehydrogenase PdxA [Mariniblastus sp.]MDA7902344.1 4-hydroxythreonine-4-phosphate dehydrogenase PdxA [Mariniblastus sp.]MDB4372665.1 4-hydroxythreonine-4-phosphate dehydrogenase PdxA [Mariniblastus sp.]MDC0294355.1 4-hydroxythreonine-4-phosphate dehydrogenase PdxA [Mariniblastus sp.]
MKSPRIAITMGDPAGVGPELCLQLLSTTSVLEECHPVIFGDLSAIQKIASQMGISFPDCAIIQGGLIDPPTDAPSTFVDLANDAGIDLVAGEISAQTGRTSFQFIESAIASAISGSTDAVVTGPIHKEAWRMAGIDYPGHTELFADRAKSDRFCMMMTAPTFSCSLVTTHVGYHEVPQLLTTDRIREVISLTNEALTRILGRKPKLIALGLNPHAGEGGLFGSNEEENIILPAVTSAANEGVDIVGPIPPDTAFLPWKREETDGYICMYHDQGLIPFKALNFDTGVNITLGLPLIRTSVDHGTALDIAWQGKADISSLISAVKLAVKLSI